MKLFTLISLMLLGCTQLILAQDSVITPKNNAMSNVIGISAEGGGTLGFTDYSHSKTNYTGKVSLEYLFPSTGMGNFGLRAFGQEGYVSGSGAQASWNNPTNEFSTRLDMYGGGMMYILSIDNSVYPWLGIGASNLWFYPKDGNGNQLPNFRAGNYSHYMLTINGDLGVRFMISKGLSINLNGGIILASKDNLDDISSGSHNDLLYTGTIGLSYYFGRGDQAEPIMPEGIQAPVKEDTVVITKEDTTVITKTDTVVISQPAEIKSIVLNGDANFEFNKSALLPNAHTLLEGLVSTMKEHPDYKWEIDGYTDGIGSAKYNMKLSKQRAQSVADYLQSQGIDSNNLKIVGYGKDNPIATNSTVEGRAMNRRVEIKLLSKGNK